MSNIATPNKLEKTFLDLAAIDEIHPHEAQVLAYIKKRLEAAAVPWKQDEAGNIIGYLEGGNDQSVALVAHVDIAAPLKNRQVLVEASVIKTDGHGILGGDDKAAVAMLLELADEAASSTHELPRSIELLFTVGEEAGCVGALHLDRTLLTSRQALVLDWTGRVNNVVTKSPAYYKVDVEYYGRTAHPAEWREGKNAGSALIEAAGQLRVGEYQPGVTCNIGIFTFGEARNQVPGYAAFKAELRSYDAAEVKKAAEEVEKKLHSVAQKHGLEAKIGIVNDSPAYVLDTSGPLYGRVQQKFTDLGLEPNFQSTYGCFDANILAGYGLEVVILGAGYYQPHSPDEYLNRTEFAEVFKFLREFTLTNN